MSNGVSALQHSNMPNVEKVWMSSRAIGTLQVRDPKKSEKSPRAFRAGGANKSEKSQKRVKRGHFDSCATLF